MFLYHGFYFDLQVILYGLSSHREAPLLLVVVMPIHHVIHLPFGDALYFDQPMRAADGGMQDDSRNAGEMFGNVGVESAVV